MLFWPHRNIGVRPSKLQPTLFLPFIRESPTSGRDSTQVTSQLVLTRLVRPVRTSWHVICPVPTRPFVVRQAIRQGTSHVPLRANSSALCHVTRDNSSPVTSSHSSPVTCQLVPTGPFWSGFLGPVPARDTCQLVPFWHQFFVT